MFYLQVIRDEKITAQREFHSAGDCTEKLLLAFEYYVRKNEKVLIRMLDQRQMLIKELNSEKGLET